MGTYERDWAEQMELDICDAFNDQEIDNEAAHRAADCIVARFPQADRLEWIGGSDYASVGDLVVWQDNTRVAVIEVKSSRSSGKGTSANISQAFFGMWFDDATGYSDWEKDDGVWAERWDVVEQLTGSRPTNQTHYVKLCRALKTDKKLQPIVDMTNAKKPAYCEHIREHVSKDSKRMSHLLHILRTGTHTISGIKSALESDISGLPRAILIGQNIMHTSSWTWDDKSSDIDDAIIDIKSSGKGVEFTQASGQTARFAIHWKNVAQGVQTPCFNVWY